MVEHFALFSIPYSLFKAAYLDCCDNGGYRSMLWSIIKTVAVHISSNVYTQSYNAIKQLAVFWIIVHKCGYKSAYNECYDQMINICQLYQFDSNKSVNK